jgi:hypothetical protein
VVLLDLFGVVDAYLSVNVMIVALTIIVGTSLLKDKKVRDETSMG